MTIRKSISRAELPFRFAGPDRTDQLAAAMREEQDAARTAPAGSPDRAVATRNVETLRDALEQSRRNDAAREVRDRELEERTAEEQRYVQERRDAAAAEVKETLRRRYMALPGATEDAFERDYPALLQDHRREELARRPTVNRRRYIA